MRDARKPKSIEFALAFVTKRAEVDAAVKLILPKADGERFTIGVAVAMARSAHVAAPMQHSIRCQTLGW